jgi:hypothetical protein
VFDYYRQIPVETALMPRSTAAMAIAVTGKTAAPQLLQWLHQRNLFTDRRMRDAIGFMQKRKLGEVPSFVNEWRARPPGRIRTHAPLFRRHALPFRLRIIRYL